MTAQKFKKYLFNFLKFMLVVLLITWLVRNESLDFKKLSTLLTSSYLFPCILAVGMTLLTACERWRILFFAQGLFMGLFDAIKMTLIGIFFGFTAPGGVGGDVVRGFYIAKSNRNAKMKSVVSVLVDRLMGIFSMIVVAIFALALFSKKNALGAELQAVLLILLLLFFVFSICWFLALSKTVYNKRIIFFLLEKIPKNNILIKAYEAFANYRNHKFSFLKAFLVSIISQIFTVIFFIFAGKGLGYNIPLEAYFSLVPVGFILSAIPISIGGIGVGQAAFLFLFSLVDKEQIQVGPMTITAFQITLFLYGLLGAYFYVLIRKTLGPAPEEQEPQNA